MACLHDHSCEDHDCSSDWSLYKHIDLPRVSSNPLFFPSDHLKLVRSIILQRVFCNFMLRALQFLAVFINCGA